MVSNVMPKKNAAAVAMAKLRSASLTKKRRSEIARSGGIATQAKRKLDKQLAQADEVE